MTTANLEPRRHGGAHVRRMKRAPDVLAPRVQVAELVVDRGYRPAVIRAAAGRPLQILVRRIDPATCTERIIFSSPHIDRRVPLRGSATIELPAGPPREVRFTCGMGRYRGRVEFVAAMSFRARLRKRLARHVRPFLPWLVPLQSERTDETAVE